MTDMELEASVRAYCRRRPFKPFIVEFFSGVQVVVDHPEGIGPLDGLWLYRGPNRAQSLFPSTSVCRLLDAAAG
ncbi:MAG: hypothetical protein FJ303_23655 [Planctomycetes bacterium]|nr:hypothetical protein [Planctomycetota bacterium]